jgi:hypothetical protein
MVRVVTKYMRDHTDELPNTDAVIVSRALTEAFPRTKTTDNGRSAVTVPRSTNGYGYSTNGYGYSTTGINSNEGRQRRSGARSATNDFSRPIETLQPHGHSARWSRRLLGQEITQLLADTRAITTEPGEEYECWISWHVS